jgi:hypothetical protein
MKITIEPTEQNVNVPANQLCPKVEITLPADDVTINEIVDLLRGALIAYGFEPATVKEAFGESGEVVNDEET